MDMEGYAETESSLAEESHTPPPVPSAVHESPNRSDKNPDLPADTPAIAQKPDPVIVAVCSKCSAIDEGLEWLEKYIGNDTMDITQEIKQLLSEKKMLQEFDSELQKYHDVNEAMLKHKNDLIENLSNEKLELERETSKLRLKLLAAETEASDLKCSKRDLEVAHMDKQYEAENSITLFKQKLKEMSREAQDLKVQWEKQKHALATDSANSSTLNVAASLAAKSEETKVELKSLKTELASLRSAMEEMNQLPQDELNKQTLCFDKFEQLENSLGKTTSALDSLRTENVALKQTIVALTADLKQKDAQLIELINKPLQQCVSLSSMLEPVRDSLLQLTGLSDRYSKECFGQLSTAEQCNCIDYGIQHMREHSKKQAKLSDSMESRFVSLCNRLNTALVQSASTQPATLLANRLFTAQEIDGMIERVERLTTVHDEMNEGRKMSTSELSEANKRWEVYERKLQAVQTILSEKHNTKFVDIEDDAMNCMEKVKRLRKLDPILKKAGVSDQELGAVLKRTATATQPQPDTPNPQSLLFLQHATGVAKLHELQRKIAAMHQQNSQWQHKCAQLQQQPRQTSQVPAQAQQKVARVQPQPTPTDCGVGANTADETITID